MLASDHQLTPIPHVMAAAVNMDLRIRMMGLISKCFCPRLSKFRGAFVYHGLRLAADGSQKVDVMAFFYAAIGRQSAYVDSPKGFRFMTAFSYSQAKLPRDIKSRGYRIS